MKQPKPIPVTAVFDIGKTNKKFLLFDKEYAIIQKQQTTLDQGEDEDGYPCENLRQLEFWVQSKLQDASQNNKIKVKSLNFSTYGASLVHLDEQGNAVPPLYNYLKPYPEGLLDEFYDQYGGRQAFALQTASPPMGMLNSGLQLYWLKQRRSAKFKRISTSLHFPQYLSYMITGERVSERTSIGCHTALWDFKKGDYHPWIEEEEMRDLFPPIHPLYTTFQANSQEVSCKTGIGIHDSSAALAPYLFASDDAFMLVSTGTWSITLNPFNKEPLTYKELQRDCLCYLDIYGNQVKASRLFLGSEYMHQTKKLSRKFGLEHRNSAVDLDSVLLNKLSRNANPGKRLTLETAHNSGPFPQEEAGSWQVDEFSSYEEAYHQLMLDLVSIQVTSIKLAQGSNSVDKLIITGGFSQNDFFVTLLASFLPDKKVYTASVPHASALGAAMVMDATEEGFSKKVDWDELLGLKLHTPQENLDVRQYEWSHLTAS